MFCPKCGKENSDENKFCVNCGTKLIKLTDTHPPDEEKWEYHSLSLTDIDARLSGTSLDDFQSKIINIFSDEGWILDKQSSSTTGLLHTGLGGERIDLTFKRIKKPGNLAPSINANEAYQRWLCNLGSIGKLWTKL